MLGALVAGERDPDTLAEPAKGVLPKIPALRQALGPAIVGELMTGHEQPRQHPRPGRRSESRRSA
jgi:hypothetical protein